MEQLKDLKDLNSQLFGTPKKAGKTKRLMAKGQAMDKHFMLKTLGLSWLNAGGANFII